MKAALSVAIKGVAKGQAPFGAAVYADDGTQLSLEHNQVRDLMFPSAHAEVLAIHSACRSIGKLKLQGYWLVSTGEPCTMCAATAAIVGIDRFVFGADSATIKQAGYDPLPITCQELMDRMGQAVVIHGSILEAECAALLANHPKT